MLRKIKASFVTIVILLLALFSISAAGGWVHPLTQMDMPTETVQPEATLSNETPARQDTPTPKGNDDGQSVASPTWTSIFTGYTPYPNSTSTNYGAMGGGGCSGMGGTGMGMSSGVITGTMTMGSMGGMGGMGSMGTGSMGSGSCSMMSGMDMTGMSGMSGMSGGSTMLGMDMTGMSGYVTQESTSIWNNPWLLIGWVVLGLLIIAILVGIIFGIVWLVRRPKQTHPV